MVQSIFTIYVTDLKNKLSTSSKSKTNQHILMELYRLSEEFFEVNKLKFQHSIRNKTRKNIMIFITSDFL